MIFSHKLCIVTTNT